VAIPRGHLLLTVWAGQIGWQVQFLNDLRSPIGAMTLTLSTTTDRLYGCPTIFATSGTATGVALRHLDEVAQDSLIAEGFEINMQAVSIEAGVEPMGNTKITSKRSSVVKHGLSLRVSAGSCGKHKDQTTLLRTFDV
jgi:hypothetical protein